MPKVVKSAGREMILKVKEFCEAEDKNHGILIPLNNVRKRVAAMTGKFWGCHIQIFFPIDFLQIGIKVFNA